MDPAQVDHAAGLPDTSDRVTGSTETVLLSYVVGVGDGLGSDIVGVGLGEEEGVVIEPKLAGSKEKREIQYPYSVGKGTFVSVAQDGRGLHAGAVELDGLGGTTGGGLPPGTGGTTMGSPPGSITIGGPISLVVQSLCVHDTVEVVVEG